MSVIQSINSFDEGRIIQSSLKEEEGAKNSQVQVLANNFFQKKETELLERHEVNCSIIYKDEKSPKISQGFPKLPSLNIANESYANKLCLMREVNQIIKSDPISVCDDKYCEILDLALIKEAFFYSIINQNKKGHNLEFSDKSWRNAVNRVVESDTHKINIFFSRIASSETKRLMFKKVVNDVIEEMKTLDEKSEGLYRCVDKKIDVESGGCVYIFEANHEFSNLYCDLVYTKGVKFLFKFAFEDNDLAYKLMENSKYKQEVIQKFIRYRELRESSRISLFPAVQEYFDVLNERSYSENVFNEFRTFHCEAYIEAHKLILELPDEIMIKKYWKRVSDIDFPLSIVFTPGEVTDEFFINAFLDNKIVLSSGKGFIHDYTIHLLPQLAWANDVARHRHLTLKYITNDERLLGEMKERIRNFMSAISNPAYSIFDNDKKILITLMGILVDIASNRWRDKQGAFLKDLLDDPSYWSISVDHYNAAPLWKKYLEKRYPQMALKEERARIFSLWGSMILKIRELG